MPIFIIGRPQLISKHGKLPARDIYRWVPVGRDLGQTLNLYPYTVAYIHKAIVLWFPNVSLYHVTLYIPAIYFVIGLGVLCFFFYSSFGILFSCVVGVILATLPGTIMRSTVGFSDRDSWCLLLGILAITSYLFSLQTQTTNWRKLLFTLVSGFSILLGGLSWEGFGVFVWVILGIEIWRFLTSEIETGLRFYLLWVFTFVLPLYLVSPAYQNGLGFATHLAAFVLIPPLVLLIFRLCKHLLITKTLLTDKLHLPTRILAIVLVLAGLIGALSYVLVHFKTFTNTTVPFSQNRLMKTVSELESPNYVYWVYLYGNIFSLGSVGLLVTTISNWKRRGAAFTVSLGFFVLTVFGREYLDGQIGVHISHILFFTAIAGCIIAFLVVAWRREEPSKNELIYVAFTTWFIFWISLSRDALRYDFFSGLPLAFFTATFIHFLANMISDKLSTGKEIISEVKQHVPRTLLKTSITAILIVPVLFWTPTAHTKRTLYAAKYLREPIPGNTPTTETFRWMRAELPNTAVVAASWIYGSQINVLGNVKTIIDQDHFMQHWIHNYNRYVFCTRKNREALEFLKTHKVTHLMLTERNILHSEIHAFIGNQKNAEQFKPISLQLASNKIGESQHLLTQQPTWFRYIDATNLPITTLNFLTAHLRNGKTTTLPYIAFFGTQRTTSPIEKTENLQGGVVLYFDENQHLEKAYYIPSRGWNSLAIRLFFGNVGKPHFVPVYPVHDFSMASVKVWEIRYPEDTVSNPEYLLTDFEIKNR